MAVVSTYSISPVVDRPGISLNEGWEFLYSKGFLKVQSMLEQGMKCSFPNELYVKLYTTVYTMCTQKGNNNFAEALYSRYENSFNVYLAETVLPSILTKTSPESFLEEFVLRWDRHLLMKKYMGSIFNYLNRFYTARKNKKSLEEVCVRRFKAIVFEAVKLRATECILELVDRSRNGDRVDHSLLKLSVSIFVAMGLGSLQTYQVDFQTAYIEATSGFYFKASSLWLNSETLISYMKTAETTLKGERKHLQDYLHPSSQTILFNTLHSRILVSHQRALLLREFGGFKELISDCSVEHLSRIYRLYAEIPESLELPAKIFREFIVNQGELMIGKLTNDNEMAKLVDEFIIMHTHFCGIIESCFSGAPLFYRSVKDAFEQLLNSASLNAPEQLANFCDKILAKGGIEDAYLLEETLENVVKLFSYVSDKDLFSSFYRKLLSKRLLGARSSSDEAERSMIGKLKLKCGAQFTSKFEGMVTDMSMAVDNQSLFQTWLRSERVSLPLEMNVQVLTSGFWPVNNSDNVVLPHVLTSAIETFQSFYNTRTANRLLKWLHQLGSVTVTANLNQSCDLICSTYQALIIMCFNDNKVLTIEQIGSITGISKEELKQQLRPLVVGQIKLFIKEPADGFAMSHTIRVDSNFVSAKRVVKVPVANAKITDDDRAASMAAISEDRRHAIEASIVRIMKSRKTMGHAQLVAEVTGQLLSLFQPDPKVIKKRIEDLITREYLERAPDSNNTYNYLA